VFESTVASTAGEVVVAREHVIRRSAVVSWILYDLANTIFSMGIVSAYFSIYVRNEVGAERVDSVYGRITAVSMAIIFVISPLLGAMTDRARRRMPFLIASTIICVSLTALLARSGFVTTAILFVIANAAYQAGLQFYDALLPEVSTEANRGRIGGIGVGIGYLGSYLAIGYGLIFGSETLEDLRFLFLIVAASFLLLSLPCFFFVRERGNPNPRRIDLAMVRESSRETLRTLREGRRYPGLIRFLVGRIFYTDAINTVILIMLLYTTNVAIDTGMTEAEGREQGLYIMMVAITFAVFGGFLWGWLTDRLGPKRTLNMVLQGWFGVFILAASVGIAGLPLWVLYVVACSAGLFLGGIWAADRPYMLRLTPPSRIGEFYGLYGMVGRFSAITGPLVWAAVTAFTIEKIGLQPRVGQGLAIITLLTFMVLSYVILQPVTDTPREWPESER
jgi:MFS transporter, UMF1 family